MSPSFDFGGPDPFTVGAVGRPGERVFYLQAREGGTLVTLKVEKEHVRALAEHLANLLGKLPTAGSATAGDLALHEPLEAAWAVGSLGVAYDETADRILLVAEELVDEEEGREPATARFRLSRAQAAAFVERADELVKAGRKPCPICGQPMSPDGHVCPRSNGHARP